MALQTAYVLHRRPYRENSQIVEMFGSVSGRVAAIIRSNKSRRSTQAPCEPFLPLLADWQGNSELKTIRSFEAAGQPFPLKGQALYAGFYLNELLLRLLGKEESHTPLFYLYEATLEALVGQADLEPVLRQFELGLLSALGYGIDMSGDGEGNALEDGLSYQFKQDQGWVAVALADGGRAQPSRFAGSDLNAIGRNDWQQHQTRQAAKRLCRLALAPLLGDKPLRSRELFKRGNRSE